MQILIIIRGNKVHSNDKYLYLVIIMSDEKEGIYVRLYNELITNYNFVPNLIHMTFLILILMLLIKFITMIK